MKIRLMFALLLCACLSTASAEAAGPLSCRAPGVNRFAFLLDTSASMNMRHKYLAVNKLVLAKAALRIVADRIPELGYDGGIHVCDPRIDILPQQAHNREAFTKALDTLDRTTPPEKRLASLADSILYWSNKLALDGSIPWTIILVSDGINNTEADPLEAARAAMAASPGLILHVISLADTPEGQALLESIAALRPAGSLFIRIEDVLDHADGDAVDFFASYVFCARNICFFNISRFEKGSFELTDNSHKYLDQIAMRFLKRPSSHLIVSGHTCNLGSKKANQRLSERRAEAAKVYLISKGVPEKNISTRGYGGQMPKYDNATKEGRDLNRRIEVDFR